LPWEVLFLSGIFRFTHYYQARNYFIPNIFLSIGANILGERIRTIFIAFPFFWKKHILIFTSTIFYSKENNLPL